MPDSYIYSSLHRPLLNYVQDDPTSAKIRQQNLLHFSWKKKVPIFFVKEVTKNTESSSVLSVEKLIAIG